MAKKTILWVEDDDEVITAFKPRLQHLGWEVASASSANEGKMLARELQPDLVMMDIVMAGEHSYAAIQDLRTESALASVPIVVFSGTTHKWGEPTATCEDALLTEACDFVDKLDKPEVLLDVIAKCLCI